MFPGILLSAKVLKYGCVIIHTSVLIVFEILRLVCITIYIIEVGLTLLAGMNWNSHALRMKN